MRTHVRRALGRPFLLWGGLFLATWQLVWLVALIYHSTQVGYVDLDWLFNYGPHTGLWGISFVTLAICLPADGLQQAGKQNHNQ